MPQTNEFAFETYVEEMLQTHGGWKPGSLAEWDKERALFPAQVFAFIADTQPKLWGEMRALHAAGLEALLVTTLVKELDTKGSLDVLRHGFKFYGKTFRLAYFKPAHGANWELLALVGKNRLTLTRQVPCHPSDNRTLDMVLAVNGLPVATIELKNPGTGQNWRHAIRQYREDREPTRAVVRVQEASTGAFRRRSRRSPHDPAAGAGENTFPAVQPWEPSGPDHMRGG
jgi:type I restriction enzyme R subunit